MGAQSDYTNAQLYELVREAAKRLRPDRPEKLSTRTFDNGRAEIGHPDAPRAHWIARRLGKPWPELVAVVVDDGRDLTMVDQAARRTAAEKWLDRRHLHFALYYISRERDEDSFTAIDYDATVDRIVTARKHVFGKDDPLAALLPTSGQIIQIIRRMAKAEAEANGSETANGDQAANGNGSGATDGDATGTDASGNGRPRNEADGKKPTKDKGSRKTRKKASKKKRELPELDEDEGIDQLDEQAALGFWNKALALAGLKPYEQSKKKGVPFIYGIHLYIEATRLLPWSEGELRRFATEADFSLSPPEDGDEKIVSHLPTIAAYRKERGLPIASEFASPKSKPVFDLSNLPTDLPKPVPQPGDWAADEARIINALCEYLDTVAARNRRQPSQHDYRAQQKGRRGSWPSASTLGRTGPESFTKWIELARPEWERRRKAQKKAA